MLFALLYFLSFLQMAPPATVLKRRHDLKTVKNAGLKLLKKFKEVKINARTDLARVKALVKTENLSEEDCKKYIHTITGEDAADYLDLSASQTDADSLRKLLHCAIILANEIGQPSGDDLVQANDQVPFIFRLY